MNTYYKQALILGIGDEAVNKRHKFLPPWTLQSAEYTKISENQKTRLYIYGGDEP